MRIQGGIQSWELSAVTGVLRGKAPRSHLPLTSHYFAQQPSTATSHGRLQSPLQNAVRPRLENRNACGSTPYKELTRRPVLRSRPSSRCPKFPDNTSPNPWRASGRVSLKGGRPAPFCFCAQFVGGTSNATLHQSYTPSLPPSRDHIERAGGPRHWTSREDRTGKNNFH